MGTKVAWDEDNWFSREAGARGSQLAPSCPIFRSGSSLFFLTGFSCSSLSGWTCSQHSWTPHIPLSLGKQTVGQCAPRMYLHCSCIISWHSGSSELRGQMQLHKIPRLYEEGVLSLASWAVFLGLPQK